MALKFRKKPVVIEAVQWHGHNFDEIKAFAGSVAYMNYNTVPAELMINAHEGHERADIGSWIIKGVQSEFYPCKSDVFAATYDPTD